MDSSWEFPSILGRTVKGLEAPLEQCSRDPGWLFDIGDGMLHNYMGITQSQYKDPYKPISIRVWFTLLTSFAVSFFFFNSSPESSSNVKVDDEMFFFCKEKRL